MRHSFFKARFGHFIHTRRIRRHYQRRPLFESLHGSAVSRAMPTDLAQALRHAAQSSPLELFKHLHAHPTGLSAQQAAKVRARVGSNLIEHEKPLSWWRHLWHCYRNPFNLLLSLLAVLSWLTADIKAATVIGTMVLLSTGLRFWQEAKSNRAADALKALVSNTALVLRPGGKTELPILQLVPGDVILLAAGDMIPADCRILSAKDLFVSQAAMTGESLPVEKFPELQTDSHNPFELQNILFMGTNVVSGAATALVLATGGRSYFGALAERVTHTETTPTAFQHGVNQVSWVLIRFMLVMVPLVFLINGFTKHDWLQALLFALSVAVGLTPEMLPMIVTSTLAQGAVRLARRKVIVKRLDAIQNFGAMDVLCTDKTGTLTQNKIFLARHLDAWGEESDAVLELAYLNSYYQTGLKNLLDVAILEHADVHRNPDVTRAFSKIDEIPFDFERRRMSVIVRTQAATHRLICKGALEEVLSVCTQVQIAQGSVPLNAARREQIREVTTALSADGLRVVAVASKATPASQMVFGTPDESELTLIGYVAFLDPPKETTAPALRALAADGITLKVLTGDNELVTAKICHEVGLPAGPILLGSAIEQLDDTALAHAVEQHQYFAKLTPAHKERIVRQLKANGHVVGFLGDGINDAPALHAADIGISVDAAVDIAKEAADIILLEKSLMVLEAGVIEGRKTFANMLKYIKLTASSNFGNVFSVLVASLFIPFLPMLPLHLLVQNLLYDIAQIAIPFDRVDEESLRTPQHWNPAGLANFMRYFGPISSLFDILTFGVMWFVFAANSAAQQTLFQSGWFIEGLLTQTLIVHMIRTQKIPFVQSRPAAALLWMTVFMIVIGIFLPMGPFAAYFKLQALPWSYFPILLGILFGYMALTQAVKGWYVQRYGWQ